MTVTTFQRARKPEEQQLRREAILSAAAELFDAEGPMGAGLNAIAARAGFTKSNVYRYFESREEVLMNLLLVELEGFVADFEAGMAQAGAGDIAAIADLTAQGFISRPRFSHLLPLIASVLEQNISVDKIVALKRGVSALYERIARALAAKLPGASLEDCGWAAFTCAALVAGIWPSTQPSPAAMEVMAMPEFAHLTLRPERDLPRAFAAILQSIL